MIASDLPTLWAEVEEEHAAKEVLMEEEDAVHPQDVVALGAVVVVVAAAKTASSARYVVREITLLLNVGTCSMSPSSRVRNLLPLPPQAPTRLIQAGTWIREPRITLPTS
jgi:hypothetical protein